VVEEAVMAVPAGTGKAWSDRAVRETRSTEAWSANMGKARTAHAAEATGVHTATETSRVHAAAEMSAATKAAMTSAAETTTAVAAASTAATGEHR